MIRRIAFLLLSFFVISAGLAGIALHTTSQPFYNTIAQARDRGSFSYDARIQTTVTPGTAVSEAGRTPRQQAIAVRGHVDLQAETLDLQLMAGSGSFDNRADVVTVQVANGVARSRAADGSWYNIDLPTGAFGANSDVLGFLSAARNISDPETQFYGDESMIRYRFQIDGPAYARLIRQQIEQSLRQQGKLPIGSQLALVDTYLSVVGTGEVLVDADGLPRRQVIDLAMPGNQGEAVHSTITVNYSDFAPASVVAKPIRWLSSVPWVSFTLNVGIICIVGFVAICLILFSRSRRLANVLALLITPILILSPLFQVPASASAAPALPATAPKNETTSAQHVAPATVPLNVVRQFVAGNDTDKDGLSDNAEGIVGTDPSKADTDGDGLSDGVEVLEVGTKPTERDTDGDGLGDGLELEPIPGPDGRIWRLDPFSADTNGDGQIDLFECVGDTFCPDADGDTVPDAWDDDNDNDGVPDRIDAAPGAVVAGARNADGSLEGVPNGRLSLSASNATPGKTLLFDFTIRPTNPGRLWYSQSALDWPADDREGQVRRVLTDTLSLTGRFADGDMRVVPSMEVKIPYVAGSFGGLPVKGNYSGTDMPSLSGVDLTKSEAIAAWFNQWLDTEKLTSYQISVRLNGADRSLLAYVPLDLQRDPIGDAPVAFTAHMLFRPKTGAVPAHEVRLVWNVQAKTDTCSAAPDADSTDGETFNKNWWDTLPAQKRNGEKYTRWEKLSASERSERWCSGTTNWASNPASIIHSYYDDFYVAALNAREDRGVEVATIAQNPDAGTAAFQPHMWNLARGLERAFVGGRDCDAETSAACTGNEQLDLTPATIKARWDYASNSGANQAERWNIPANALRVRTTSFADEGDSAMLFVTTQHGTTQQQPLLLSFLNDTFVANDQARTALPTVMIARLHTTASIGLQGASANSNGEVDFNMADAPVVTKSSLSWKPYRYKGAGIWEQANLADAWPQIASSLDVPLQTYGGASGANASAVRGSKDMLLAFYVALNTGRGGMVMADGVATNRNSAADADEQLAAPAVVDAVAGMIAESMANTLISAQHHRTLMVNADSTALLTALGNQRSSGDGGPAISLLLDVGKLPNDGNDALYSKAFAALNQTLSLPEPSGIADSRFYATMQTGADSVDKANTIYGAIDGLKGAFEAGELVRASSIMRRGSETISKAMDVLSTADRLGEAQTKIASLASDLQNLSKRVSGATELVTDASSFSPDVLGIVVEVVVFAGKLMALIASQDINFFTVTSLIAETAGSVAVNVFMLGALAAIVPIGTVIAALIGLIDAAIGLACGFSESFKEKLDSISEALCDGIAGNLTKLITALFWDTQPLINMEASDRLTPTNWKMLPQRNTAGDDIGMVAGNTLDVSADVITKLSLNTKFNYSALQILLMAGKLPNATFRYQFTTEEEKDNQKINERLNLEQGQMGSSWKAEGSGLGAKQVATQLVTTTLTLATPQLNWHPENFYLAEGYAIPALYCVLRLCSTYTKDDSTYLNLAPSFAFDVFPAKLDGFMSLTDSDGNGSFRMAWDEQFPDLKDADGDGLVNRAAGGADPGDNAPDSDRDGLSDMYELQNAALGLNPSRADTDNDGLSDLEEIRRNLDPAVADMDNDGLTDSEEVAGWQIIYGYDANDMPLRLLVTSDPRNPDTDNDGLLDIREKLYGFNPRVPNSNEPLQIQSKLIEPDGLNDGIVPAGSSIGFSATISNTLRDRFALGLFEADLESSALKPDILPTSYRLSPLATSSLNGTISLSGQTSTSTTNVATRAGAIIASVDQLSGGRVLWLPFEEQSGSTSFADASPFRNDATCSGMVCPDSIDAGYSGRGLSFGSGQSLNIAHSPTLANTTFSLSFRMNPGSATTPRSIIEKTSGANGRTFSIGIDSSRKLRVAADSPDCATNAVDQLSTTTLLANSWGLITLVASPTQLNLYINGSAAGSWSHNGLCANTAPIRISGPNGGMLDDVALYPYPMTPLQVQSQFRDPVLDLTFNGTTSDSSNLRQTTTNAGNGNVRLVDSRNGDRVGAFDKRSWIDVTSSPSLNMSQGTGQFTLAAYIRPVPLSPDNGEWQAIMGKSDQFNTYPSLYVNAAGQLKVEFGNGSALCESGATSRTIPAGAWSHVAVSYTGSQFIFYINGAEAERLALSSACSAGSRPVGDSLFVGRNSPNARFAVNRIQVIDEGDGIGTAEYEALWKGSRVWYNDDIDIGDYNPSELQNLKIDSDDSFRFELKEEDTCDSCHDILIDMQLRNYQVNAGSVWNYDDDGEGKIYWQLWNNWFNGDLDNVQIYRVALGAAGARDLYSSLNNRAYALQTRLEEPPTTTLFRDGSGNLQTGFCSGASCPTTGLPGRDGQAAAFDGDDAIALADRPGLDLTAGLTAAAWVKLDDVNADQKIINKYDPAKGGYSLGVINGKLYGEIKDSSGNRTEILGGTITSGVWTHLAISASPGQYLIGYINGSEVQRSPIPQLQGNIVAVGRPIAGSVTLYGDKSYEDSSDNMVWTTSQSESTFDPPGFGNDDLNEASSIRVNNSCVRLYDDEDYGGDSVPVCDDTPVLASFNDRAESMRHYGTSPRYDAGVGGLKLDRGQLQYLHIDPTLVGNPTFSTFSAAAWVNVNLSDEWHTIVSRGDAGLPEGFSWRINNQGQLVYQAGNGSFTSSGSIASNTWTHVAVTHDGTTVRFYINGNEAGSQTFTGNINDMSGPILVGRLPRCGTSSHCDFFNGAIRSFALYTRALTAAEVSGLRTTASGAAFDGQVVYLPLDTDQGMNGNGAATFRAVQAPAFVDNSLPLLLGRAAWDNTMFAHGMIDEITLLEYAADSAEVAALVQEAPTMRLALDDVFGSTSFANVAGSAATCGGATACPQAGARGRIREAAVFGTQEQTGLVVPGTTAALPSFSVELWVQPEAVRPGEQVLVAKANTDGSNANLVLSLAPGTLTPRLRVGTTEITAQRALNQGQWNHVVATYNGTLHLYINGTAETVSAIGSIGSNTEMMRVGFQPGIGVGFNGMLDELSLYSQALSAETVATHYQYQESWFDVVDQHQLTIDGDNPTATIGLANNGVIGTQPRRVHVMANDPTSRVQTVWYDADGDATEGPWQAAEADNDRANWFFTYTPAGDGSFPLHVYAEDIFGHQSAVASTMVRVDTLAPSVALDSHLLTNTLRPVPGTGADQGVWLLNLTGSVSDNLPGTPGVAAELLGTEGSLASMTADVHTGTWSGQFRFSAPPNGRYVIRLHATDDVGNRFDAEPATVALDSTAPVADVTIGGSQIGNPVIASNQSNLLRAPLQSNPTTGVLPPVLHGTLADIPSLADTVVMIHAEETSGATSFLDGSVFQHIGTCAAAACPSSITGQTGRGLHFDGADDQINFASIVARPDNGMYGVSIWARPAAGGTLFTAGDASGSTFELQTSADTYTVLARVNGALAVVGGGSLTPNAWNHIAVSFDGQMLSTYSGGALVQRITVNGTVAGFDHAWFGSGGGSSFYQGDADELAVYSVPLSAQHIAALSHAIRSPITTALPRLLNLKDEANPSAALNLTATLALTDGATTWNAAVPQGIEGIYQLDISTSDSLGNQRDLPSIWRGVIDTKAPMVQLFLRRMADGRTLVRCQVSDFNLDPTQINCPVPQDQWHYNNLAETWYTTRFPDMPRRVEMNTSTVVLTGSVSDHLQACDSFGNCTEVVGTTDGFSGVLSAFTAPAAGQVITTTGPITLSGISLADVGLERLRITANGTEALQKTYQTETSDEWATAIDLEDGFYTFTSVVTATNGAVYTDTLSPNVMVDRHAPTLFLPQEGDDAPHANGNLLEFTLGITEAVALSKLEAQLDGGFWQNIDIGQFQNGTASIAAALDLSSLGMLDGQVVELRVRSTDKAGLTSSLVRQLVLDTTAPRLSTNQITFNDHVGLVASGSVQENGGTPELRLIVVANGIQSEYPIQLVADATGIWTWQVEQPYTSGFETANLIVTAVDPSGNQSQLPLRGLVFNYQKFFPIILR